MGDRQECLSYLVRGLQSLDHQHDERLLIEAAQENPSRFADLYELHFERVYGYVVRRVRERALAEEITSHVFQQALANLGKFKWRGAPFVAWLCRIASNSIADRAQKLARESGDESLSSLVDTAASPEADLEQVETLARIFKLVDKLPWDQRFVIRARFAEELSIRDIARKLSRSEGAVKQLQFRALQNLRARVSEQNV